MILDPQSAEWPPVGVVLVNWNGKEFLEECLHALKEQDYPQSLLRPVIVDNLSQDGSVDYVRQEFPNVTVIENDVNNYARANNVGAKVSDWPMVALLNNDTRVEKEWLSSLVTCLREQPDAAAVGSKILFMDGRVNSTGIDELKEFHWRDRGFGETDEGQYEKRETVKGLSGCSLLLRRESLEKVGYLDEDFEMYYEDVDLSYRLRATGQKLYYEPKSVVWHKYNASISKVSVNGKKDHFGERNRLFVVARHFAKDLAKIVLGSRFILESPARDVRGFLPLLLKKWKEGGATEAECASLEALVGQAKFQLTRQQRQIRAKARTVRHHDRQKLEIKEKLDEQLEHHRRLVDETIDRMTREVDSHKEKLRNERERLEAEMQERSDVYEDMVRKAVVDWENEQKLREDRETWLTILLGEIQGRKVRKLDESEQSLLEAVQRRLEEKKAAESNDAEGEAAQGAG